jgi:hypothetical protein
MGVSERQAGDGWMDGEEDARLKTRTHRLRPPAPAVDGLLVNVGGDDGVDDLFEGFK